MPDFKAFLMKKAGGGGRMPPPAAEPMGPEAGPEAPPEVPEELVMAAQEFIAAVHSKDAEGVARAFQALDDISDSLKGEPGQGEPEGDEGGMPPLR